MAEGQLWGPNPLLRSRVFEYASPVASLIDLGPVESVPYCNAEPGSEEWKEYQIKRLKALRQLKKSKAIAEKLRRDLDSDYDSEKMDFLGGPPSLPSQLHTILKKQGLRNRKSPDSIRWKEPIQDKQEISYTELDLTKKHKGKLVIKVKNKKPHHKTQKEKVKVVGSAEKLTENLRKSRERMKDWRSKNPAAMAQKAATTTSKVEVSKSVDKVPSILERIGSFSSSLVEKVPPKFPMQEACTALPGSPEWEEYWSKFNRKVKEYNKQVESYSQGLDKFTQDLNKYRDQVKQNIRNDTKAYAREQPTVKGTKSRIKKTPSK